ncbi:MAG TPA: Do family serine endopeptidase [Hyphomonadaceae bacterium]|jgi:Do/DeqQ family serine protease
MNRQNILLVAAASITTAFAMMAVPAVGQLGQQTPGAPVSGPVAEPEPHPQLIERAVPASQASIQQSFAPVVRRTAPAVVNVYSSVNITRSNCPYANDPFWAAFYCGDNVQTRREKVDNSLGSGVIVGADGVIVTNNHVVEQGQEFRVVLSDRREFPATLVMKDDKSDLAVLKIDPRGETLPTLAFADTRGVQVGDLVLAIGNPFGVGQSVSSGIISALARTDVGDFSSFIQTDASVNPGNSGGALVDMNGRLVGVNTLIFSRGGGSNGVGFAIPAEMVKRVVDAAVRGGTLVRPWLGAKGDTIDGPKAAALGLDRPRGVLISDVYAGGPAAKAGLREGDIILSIDGREVFDDKGMKFIAATKAEGEAVDIVTIRNGSQRSIRATLAAPPGTTKAELIVVGGRNPFTGAQVAQLSPALAEQLGLDPFRARDGMLVYSVPPRTIARNVGFQPGDIIREINGAAIRTPRDLETAISRIEGSADGVWRLAIERNGERKEVTLRS